jgi:hypothetical protein
MDNDECGCAARQAWMNERLPGSGDFVKRFAEPIASAFGYKGREQSMNSKVITYVAIFLAGVMLSGKVGALPVINKLPRL